MEATVTLPIEQLRESPFNPRRIYGEAALQELANSIATDGVLQPILVRPVTGETLEPYEIVFGHRRYRASLLAQRPDIRAIVRAMTDEEARRAQLVENLQRDDVHAIEEAEGFGALMREHGITADQLVQQTGKSRSYIYGRLKLTSLCDEVRKACLAGEIGAEAALLVARIPGTKLQQKALQAIKARNQDITDGGKQSYRRIRDLLVDQFSLDLKADAMWALDDATLVIEAGACTTCPKRSGNTPELYGDVVDTPAKTPYGYPHYGNRGANICMDPECFAAKKAAHLAREADALRAKGKIVVGGNAARAAVTAHGQVKGAYIALKEVRTEIKKVKGTKPATVLIQDPRTGKTVEAVKRAELEDAGVQPPAPPTDRWAEQQKRQIEERERRVEQARVETARRLAVLDQTLEAMRCAPRSVEDLVLIARQAYEGTNYDGRRLLAQRHGFDGSMHELEKAIALRPAEWLALFAIECALIDETQVAYHNVEGSTAPTLAAVARRYGIDPDPAPNASTPSPAARAPKRAKKMVKAEAQLKLADAEATLEPELAAAEEEEEQMDDAGCAGEAETHVVTEDAA